MIALGGETALRILAPQTQWNRYHHVFGSSAAILGNSQLLPYASVFRGSRLSYNTYVHRDRALTDEPPSQSTKTPIFD